MMNRPLSIAIDGLVASWKGATARWVAKTMWYVYLDTGAMYRWIAWYCLKHKIDPQDTQAIIDALDDIAMQVTTQEGDTQITINGTDVTSELRTMEVNRVVGVTSKIPEVRSRMRAIQSAIGKKGGVVIDGRDAATHIIPDALLKVFLTCDITVRAKRRQLQLKEKHNDEVPLDEIIDSIQKRDEHDYLWANPTSKKADDARDLDTTHHTLESQIQKIVDRAKQILSEKL